MKGHLSKTEGWVRRELLSADKYAERASHYRELDQLHRQKANDAWKAGEIAIQKQELQRAHQALCHAMLIQALLTRLTQNQAKVS